MTHPHAPPEASSGDAPFLRVFLSAFLLLTILVATFTALVDPLGRFGTGLLPPVVTSDRDQKARLYLARRPQPELVVLGSSRSKTIAPACLSHLSGQSAFNFAVNGAGSEDLVAILRFILAQRDESVRTLLVGLDPEMLQPSGGVHRALEGSRALGPYAPDGTRGHRPPLAADLLGWQAVSSAVRSVMARHRPAETPEFVLEADGLERYARIEDAIRAGRFDQSARVRGSIPGALSRYEAFPSLDSARVAWLGEFLAEARRSSVVVRAFIPPVHPEFARHAEHTAWRDRTNETVNLLTGLERDGLLRYVEIRGLTADTTGFVDAVHFLAPVAARLAGALMDRPDGCALQ
jgi:hypothetical protein